MPKISLEHFHSLTAEEAQQRIQELMERFSRKYGFSAHWERRHCARVSGRGIKGSVELQPGRVRFELKIPLLFSPFKPRIEAGIRDQVSRALA